MKKEQQNLRRIHNKLKSNRDKFIKLVWIAGYLRFEAGNEE
jgi:hypothetical protein